MTACVKCSRALQPAWKYCIYCGTRTAAAPAAARSRPIPRRTAVPGYASVAATQSPLVVAPIVPPAAPAPLSAAPVDEPVSSEWPESLGERPSLRSALAATEVPAPTPPIENVPPPEDAVVVDEAPPAVEVDEAVTADEPVAIEGSPAPEPESESEPESEPDPEPEPDEPDADPLDDEEPANRTGSVNTLAVLALLIGILACPLAALFGHLALGQVRASGERGVIPAWIAIVLGYLWLGFWLVFIISYFATNG